MLALNVKNIIKPIEKLWNKKGKLLPPHFSDAFCPVYSFFTKKHPPVMVSFRVPHFKWKVAFLPLICCAVQGSPFGKGNLNKQFPWSSPSVMVQEDLVFEKSIVFPPQTRIKINPSSNVAENKELKSLLETFSLLWTSAGDWSKIQQ